MSNWKLATIADVTLYQRAGGTPTATDNSYYGEEIPFVVIEDITKSSRYLTTTKKFLSQKGLINSAAWLIKEPHVLYSMYATVGKPIINHISCATNQAIIALKENDFIEQEFLYYQLSYIRPSVYKYTAQTTQSNLNASVVKSLPISYPTSKEIQKKIINILSCIDHTIEKTEALIEKYQQIKTGLMQDLFTRGIGSDGKLRPTREQAPELYHETKIGWIPKDWRVVTCQDVCEKIIDCKNRTPPISADGYPVIRTSNVRHGEFRDRALVFTDLHSYIIWTARGKPKVDDVVITREAPVGEVCKIPERHAHACLGQRMMLYRTDSYQINNDFFLYALQSEPIKLRLDLISGGSTVGHVRVGDIRDLWMYQPASEIEQTYIANALNSISTTLETETEKLKKLVMQKTGLMHDLLSGKKSVSVDAKETTHV